MQTFKVLGRFLATVLESRKEIKIWVEKKLDYCNYSFASHAASTQLQRNKDLHIWMASSITLQKSSLVILEYVDLSSYDNTGWQN